MRTLPVLVVAVLLAACGEEEPRPANTARTPDATPARTTTPAATASPEGVDPLAGASTKPVVVAAKNREVALLTAVRAARHEGYDRVVFEFANELPGYDVRYLDGPAQADGSGDAVEVDGEHVLQLRMENALDADLSKPSAPSTYTGPARFSPDTPVVAELARTGGFEGVLTWVAGVRDEVDFRVSTLGSPPRLVVDLRNH